MVSTELEAIGSCNLEVWKINMSSRVTRMPAAVFSNSLKLFQKSNEFESDVNHASSSSLQAADSSKHLSRNLISNVYGLKDFKALAKPWHPSFLFKDDTKNGVVSLELG